MDSYLGNNTDPLSLNLYTYVKNNPVFYVDPNGHEAVAALYVWVTSVLSSPNTQMDMEMIAYDISQGDYFSAALDGIGVLVPGGTGFGQGTKTARQGMRNKGFKGIKKFFAFGDEAADVKKIVEGMGNLTSTQIDNYLVKAINNPNSNKIVLGVTGSYDEVAEGLEYTYFKMSDNVWDDLVNAAGNNYDEIWKVNETFLDEQIKAGKEIFLSNDPTKGYYFDNGVLRFFQREIDYLTSKGYEFTKNADGLWKACK